MKPPPRCEQDDPEQPEDMQRFGLLGEWLLDQPTPELRTKQRKAIRAILRTLEEQMRAAFRQSRYAGVCYNGFY